MRDPLRLITSVGQAIRKQLTVENFLLLLFTILILFLVFFFFSILRFFLVFLIVLSCILLGALSTLYQRITVISLGIDLIVFFTVVAGAAFGPLVGAFVGFSSYFLGQVITNRFNQTTFVSLPAVTLMGLLAGFFASYPIATLGITLTILFDFIIVPIYLLMGSSWFRSTVFVVGHILTNWWLFTTLGEPMLSLLV